MNNNFISTSTVLDKIFSILQKIISAVFCVVVVMAILLPIFKENMIGGTPSVTLGFLELELNPNLIYPETAVWFAESLLLTAAVYTIACWFYLRIVRKIMVPVKEGNPFKAGISNDIRKLGIYTLIFGAITQVCSIISSGVYLGFSLIDMIIDHTTVTHCSYSLHFDITFVFVSLIIFLLSYIFKYGEALQRESDETL